jgi:hypothetical protein
VATLRSDFDRTIRYIGIQLQYHLAPGKHPDITISCRDDNGRSIRTFRDSSGRRMPSDQASGQIYRGATGSQKRARRLDEPIAANDKSAVKLRQLNEGIVDVWVREHTPGFFVAQEGIGD